MGSHYTCRVCEQHLDFCTCSKPDRPGMARPTLKPKERPMNAKAPNAKKVTRKNPEPAPKRDPAPVEELQDFSMTLSELDDIVQGLIAEHGPRATIYCDAGHNNVDVLVRKAPQYAKLKTLPDDVLLGNESMTEGRTYKVIEIEDVRVKLETDDPRSVAWVPIGRVEFIEDAS